MHLAGLLLNPVDRLYTASQNFLEARINIRASVVQ